MEKTNKINSYKRLLTYLYPYKSKLLLSILCMLVVASSNLVVPWIIKDVIDKVLEKRDVYMLSLVIIGVLIVFLFRGITTFGHRYLMGRTRGGDPDNR